MIKGKINTFGFWLYPIMIVFYFGLFIFMLLINESQKDFIISSIFCFFWIAISFPIFWKNKLITIDTSNSKIIFTQVITRQNEIYNFNEIEGYVDVIKKPSRGKSFRVLYLMQNKKIIKKISAFTFSNLDELESGLKPIKYFGRINDSYSLRFKTLFRKDITV